jgi:site-specific recombinase XerD
MFIRQPAIRSKRGRGYFVRWGGKDWHLSTDFSVAEKLFFSPLSNHPGSLQAWSAWAQARRSGLPKPAGTSAPHPTIGHHEPVYAPSPAHPPTTTTRTSPTATKNLRLTIIRVAAMLEAHYLDLQRPDAARYFRYHLRRFLHVHGLADLVEMSTPNPRRGRYTAPVVTALQAFKEDLTRSAPPAAPKLSPKTINHDLTAVTRLFNFASSRGLCPPVDWRGLKKLPTRRGTPEPMSPESVRAMFGQIAGVDARLLPLLAACYLACCRPTEALRLVRGEGVFESISTESGPIDAAIFRPRIHKNSWRAAGDEYGRAIIITDECRSWIGSWCDLVHSHGSSGGEVSSWRPLPPSSGLSGSAKPWCPWSRLDSFSAACVGAGLAGGPHVLRDSSASHLRALGMPLEDVRTCLGHVPTGEWRSYARVPWPKLRAGMSRLTLRGALDR